jgi:excinuclease ABC subunit C
VPTRDDDTDAPLPVDVTLKPVGPIPRVMESSEVRTRAADLPTDPGVYQFFAGETVLYVGKAVDLRARVRSYADPRSERIGRMVDRADRIDVAVTETETQALLLEANLIKRHQPRYNVRLKDDKSYPLVQLTDHPVPRIEVTRDPDESATVFGPFTDVGRVETAVKALRETYGLRGCSDHKYAGRERPCLDYEMGLCSAPCTGEISEGAYAGDVTAAERFFRGETGVLADPLRRAMEEAAAEANFERAANLRDRLDVVESFHGDGGEAVAGHSGDRTTDVLGVAIKGESATVARLHAEGGQLVDRTRHRLDAPEDEDRVAALLSAFVPQYYAERDLPDVLLLPERPTDSDVGAWLEAEGVAVRVPGAGREAKLVELALKNARRHVGQADEAGALADALGIARPERVEGFDVSHAAGTAVVGSDVCFVDGSAEKSAYRRKKLPDRNDDYANMYDLLRWRAERAVGGRDDRPDPDLLLIDGGRGQLDAAREALADVGWDVPVVALAKAEERVVTPDRTLDPPGDAPYLHLLQRVRDEAHRFAVQYHQTLRDDVSTVLDDVPGVGPELRRRLLRRFGSVENVRTASRGDLTDVEGVGETTADAIVRRL